MVCSCGFFFEQCASQAPAQTALPARYAAKQQRPCQALVIVFIEESLLLRPMLRRPAGQATSFRLKFYAAGVRRTWGVVPPPPAGAFGRSGLGRGRSAAGPFCPVSPLGQYCSLAGLGSSEDR